MPPGGAPRRAPPGRRRGRRPPRGRRGRAPRRRCLPRTRSGTVARSPWTPATRSATPVSSDRRSRIASASGLGSTTVTRWPSSATRTANPPVPPPTSRTSAATLAAARAAWEARPTPRRCAPRCGADGVRRRWRAPTWRPPYGPREVRGHGCPHRPELPGEECHSLRGRSQPVRLAGRLDVGVRARAGTRRVHQHPAGPPSCPVRARPSPAGLLGRLHPAGPRPPPSARHASCSAGSSQHPVARSETPRRPVRRSSPRTTQQPRVEHRGGVGARARPRRRSRRPARWRRRGSGRPPGAPTGSAGSGWRP